MRVLFIASIVLALACVAFGNPTSLDHPFLLRQRRQAIESTGYTKLVQELIENLRKAAGQARESVNTFSAGLGEELKKSRAEFQENLSKIRDRVTRAIGAVSDKFLDSGVAIRECVESHAGETDALFNEAMEKTNECGNERMKEAGELMNGLTSVSDEAQEFTSASYEEMRNCSKLGGNFLVVGSCLGAVAMKTELKGAVFLTQSGVAVARLNLFLATLPAALEVCAGNSLVGAGVGTARIVMEIGSCSASSVFNTFTGNDSALKPTLA